MNNPTWSPNLYLDTSVIAALIQKQHTAAASLFELIASKHWKWSISAFTLMELLDINQDNSYVLKQLRLGVHIKQAYKSLDQRDLNEVELKSVQTLVQSIGVFKNQNFTVYDFEKNIWDKAIDLKACSNISAPDIIHLATAIAAGCDLLITLDNFFRKEAESYIRTCLPEQAEKTLKEIGFKV